MLLLAIFPDINLQFSTSQCSFGSARPQNLDLRLDSMPGKRFKTHSLPKMVVKTGDLPFLDLP